MQTRDCRAALGHLVAYLEDSESHRAELVSAFSHIQGCPHCESRIGHLVRALAMDKEDRLTCQECEDLLPEYLQAEIDGQAEEEQWGLVAYHLQTCPRCSEAYATLSDLLELAYGERGEEPPCYPTPDLSFLGGSGSIPSQPVSVHWHLDEWGRLIIEFSAELLRTLRLPPLQPALAMTRSESSESQRTRWQFSLEGAVEDLEVIITAQESRGDPAHCQVIAQVDIPSQGGWPNLADTEVTLKRDDEQLDTQVTDAFGKAVFEGIAAVDLAHLVFEITPCT